MGAGVPSVSRDPFLSPPCTMTTVFYMSTPLPSTIAREWRWGDGGGGGGPSQKARPEGGIKENRLHLKKKKSWGRFFEHDNPLSRGPLSRANSCKKWSGITECVCVLVRVCVWEKDGEGLLWQLQASAQQKAFKRISTQSLQPLTQTALTSSALCVLAQIKRFPLALLWHILPDS